MNKIIKSLLNDPEKWTQGEYVLVHKKGLGIWIGVGPLFYHICQPDKISLSLKDKYLLWIAIRKWRTKRLYLLMG